MTYSWSTVSMWQNQHQKAPDNPINEGLHHLVILFFSKSCNSSPQWCSPPSCGKITIAVPYIYIWNLEINGTDEPICRAGTETQRQRTDLRSQQGKERVGEVNRAALKHTYYHIQKSQLVGSCSISGSSAWCSVTAQRDGRRQGMREKLKMEGVCAYLQLIHTVWQKPTQHYKAIILHFNK